jgi:hypothetical protein
MIRAPGFSYYFFNPSRQLPAWQEHASPAPQAFQANVSAQANNFPFVSPTGVWFAQSQNVVHLQIRQHAGIITCWLNGHSPQTPGEQAN